MANDTCDIWKYWLMNKTLTTNSVAALILVSSFIESPYQNILFNIGAFALSGSLTNNLAVYMLFEKIPLIYGSGVVQNNFNQFKVAIKGLVLKEFFNRNVWTNDSFALQTFFYFRSGVMSVGREWSKYFVLLKCMYREWSIEPDALASTNREPLNLEHSVTD